MRKATYKLLSKRNYTKDSPIIDEFIREQATPEYISGFDTGVFDRNNVDVVGEIEYSFIASVPLPPRGVDMDNPVDYISNMRKRFTDGIEIAMARKFGSVEQVFVGRDTRKIGAIIESGYLLLPIEVTIDV